MKDNKHYAIGFRLTQEDMEKFKFIKEEVKGLKIKRGEIPYYGVISKSDVIRECLKLVYDYFANEEHKKVELLMDLKREILKDKIKLYEMQYKSAEK